MSTLLPQPAVPFHAELLSGISPGALQPGVDEYSDMLSRIWQQNLPLMRARLDSLQRAAEQAVEGHFPSPVRTEAIDLAHKLAGSLGMFGYPRGTDLAREMEHMLESEDPLNADHFRRLVADLRTVVSL